MFALVRLIFEAILIFSIIHLIRKYRQRKQISHRYKVFLFAIYIFISVIISVIPFENAFYNFKSPESVYEYVYPDIRICSTIEGGNSSFIVGEKNNKYTYLIVPKTKSGWSLGLGSEMQQINHVVSDNIIITVYKHKKTGDTYASVLDINGNYCDVTDEFKTEFIGIKNENPSSRAGWVYYGYIPEYNSNGYLLQINDESIEIGK